MTTRRASPRRFAPSLRPRLTWRAFEQTSFTVLPGALSVHNLGSVGGANSLSELGVFGDYTVRRMRGRISAQTLEAANTNGYDVLYWGVLIVTTEAFIATNGVPDPRTDSPPWMAYDVIHISRKAVSTPLVMVTQLLDTKAMRKVNENNAVVCLAIKADSGNDSAGAQLTFAGRLLVSHGKQ